MNYPTKIELCEGKYSVIYNLDTGQSECFRYGEPWRDLCGDKMVLAMFDRIVELEEASDSELLKALEEAADQIRKCDYTPARSTLLQAIAAHKVRKEQV